MDLAPAKAFANGYEAIGARPETRVPRESPWEGLARRDVDLDDRLLTVRYRSGEALHLVPPKTAGSRHVVPLPDAGVDALKLRQEKQNLDRVAASADSGLIFTTAYGTPLSPRNDYRDFRRLIEKAGLPQVRLHGLRHAAASLMLAQGVSPRVVIGLLGSSAFNRVAAD